MTGLLPAVERLGQIAYGVYVAPDNFDVVADYLTGIVGTGRRMTLISRYLTRPNDPLRDVHTSLRQSTETRYPDGIERWTQRRPVGHHFVVHLDPGIHAFGFSVYDGDVPDETAARRIASSDDPRHITLVQVQGDPGDPSTADRIRIVHWNSYGVATETTIAFEEA